MGYLAGTVIVLWVLGIIFVALFRAIGAASRGADDAVNDVVKWLGRRHLGVVAVIPEELIAKPKPLAPRWRLSSQVRPTEFEYPAVLPLVDAEMRELKAYDPKVSIPPKRPAAVFQESIETVFSDSHDQVAQSIDIDRIRDVLALENSLPYERLFETLGQTPCYPIAPPAVPGVAEPPTWIPWRLEIEEPRFDPPYYGRRLSLLNRFVDAAHSQECQKVQRAREIKSDLLARCLRRNAELESLTASAKERFDTVASRQEVALAAARKEHARGRDSYIRAFSAEQGRLVARRALVDQPGPDGLMARVDAAFRTMTIPPFVSREGQSRFDQEAGILIHEHRFPDLSTVEWTKRNLLKAGWTNKPASQKERKECAPQIYPALCLRLACEIARLDTEYVLKAVAINGWADYTERSTGQRKRAYCASLFATKAQLLVLRLDALDPLDAFAALKGISARTLELTPIAPVIRLDTNDKRFVDGREVLGNMAEGENLASMDWGDFEHLCRQLFEKAFAASGAEVKVTQASRDKGVDAIIFDPDPLRGGKIVIQAKRYTNLVDVSAVRDLYGTVHNEGAIKGILVTTSRYGPDSYSFAKDKPLTLIDGAQLLGLLDQHGYKFRIDLAEARKLLER